MLKNTPDLRKYLLFGILIYCYQVVNAQITPYSILFDDTLVNSIYITMDPDSLNEMYENLENEHEYAVQFVYDSPLVQDTLQNVGFRLRGNTSLSSAKKSFKVAFNTYEPGRKFEGAKKLNLIGNHNDPTMAREKIYFDIYNSLGLPTRRVSFVRVYINESYFGLYALTEEYDDIFLRDRFGDDSGNLYKCYYGSNLNYQGTNQAAYNTYELESNQIANDKSDLIEFIEILNNTPIANLPCELEKVFDVDQFLKIYALDVSTGHWDNYGANQNNFYLYHNAITDKIEFLSYDCDNTMGVDWFGIDWAERDIYNWNFDDRPLVERLMQVDAYRDRFSYYINYISTVAMNPDVIIPHIDSIRELIAPAAFEDLFRSFDYGYTYDDFYNGFDMNDIDDHTPYGIENFIIARTDNTLEQVELNAIPPIIKYPTHTPGLLQANSNAQFNVLVEDDASINTVTISYSNDNLAFTEIPMYDDGAHQDGAANDGNYGIDIEILNGETDFYYFITATDVDGLSSNFPACESLYLPIGFTAPNLVINEFMAINTTTLADEDGVYSDYIELFNRGNTDIYLGDKFLSDEWDRPSKWRLPNFNLFAGEYLIIYADDNPEAGDYHCGFKLDGDKDEIGLFAGPEYAYAIIDSISFINQKADTATGRIPNGSGPFIELSEPSPGQNNEIIVPPVDSTYTESVIILGNPASDATIVVLGLTSLTSVQFDMVDLNGQVIFRITEGIMGSGSYIYPLNIQGIASGIYFFRLIADDKVSTYKFVVY